jgi:hypothetical protein
MKSFHKLGLAVAAFAISANADAAVVTKTFDFTASQFTGSFSPAVVLPTQITGSFTVAFDDAILVNNIAGVVVNSLTTPYTGGVLYRFDPRQGNIAFGANGNVGGMSPGTNDFFLGVSGVFDPGATKAGSFSFVTTTNVAIATAGNVVVNERIAAVPEASTWAMMLAGFTLIGATARYRRRGARIANA